MLATIGFDPGPLDEPFGTRTYKAVASFRRRVGGESDGVVGPRTSEALEQAVADRAARPELDERDPSDERRITLSDSVNAVAHEQRLMTARELATKLWEDHATY